MMKSLVTVIVPVYNIEKYLEFCIKSLINQTFKNFKVLLINDGSNDSSGEICDKYATIDSRIKVLHHLKNEGLPSARRTGLLNVNTKYFTFCDGDDFFEKNRLFKLVNAIAEGDYDVVNTGFTIFKSPHNFEKIYFKSIDKNISSDNQIARHLINDILSYKIGWAAWSRIYKSNVILDNQIDPCDSCGGFAEDLALVLESSLFVKKIKSINLTNYFYRKRSDSILSKSSSKLMLNELNEVSNHFTSFLSKHKKHKKLIKLIPLFHMLIFATNFRIIFAEKNEDKIKLELSMIKNKIYFEKQANNFSKLMLSSIKFCGIKKTIIMYLFKKYILKQKKWERYRRIYKIIN